MSEEERAVLQAYADGVNDFIDYVRIIGDKTASIFPPEFYVFDAKLEKWHPVDSLAFSALVTFGLTWDWAQDYIREIIKIDIDEDLAELLSAYTMDMTMDGA